MGAPRRMLRLLQGDVGSGKTVVALLAMAIAVESGAQAALMAPTEVLARQHLETIAPLAEKAGLRIALLTGREKGRARKDVLERLAAGDIDIIIGTHALFQPDVVFRDLAFAVIDEQHRFGVHQRLSLQSKGGSAGTDVLVMTATPDPAHPGHDALRRPRRVAAHREAARPQADRDQSHPDRLDGEADRAPARAARTKARRSIGCAR